MHFCRKRDEHMGIFKKEILGKTHVEATDKNEFSLGGSHFTRFFFLANDAFLALSPSIGYADDDEI